MTRIELLYFAGCPNHDAFLPHLLQLLRHHEDEGPVQLLEVLDDAQAQRLRFLGSPSLRVDGRDVEVGSEERATYGLQCRIYQRADGASGAPPDDWIVAALQA